MELITRMNDERMEFDTLCPQCGPRPLIDEDGCCASCGCEAQGEGVDTVMQSLRAALERAEKAEADLQREKDSMQPYFVSIRELEAENERLREALSEAEDTCRGLHDMVKMLDPENERLEKAIKWACNPMNSANRRRRRGDGPI